MIQVLNSKVYWLAAGAFLGFGLMAAFSIGIPFFLLGMVMVIVMVMALYRVWRAGGRGLGLVLVTTGLVPSMYLTLSYVISDRSNTFYPDDFYEGVLVYVVLMVVGAVWFLVDFIHSRPQAPYES